jgi:hypothetical protein
MLCDKGTKWQGPEGLKWNRSHQKVNLGLTEEADASTCLIGPVIPPHVDSERKVLVPTKSVHYASETSMGLFGNSFQMNLRLMKQYAVIKGTRWLEKMHS